jgi:hypothetical protein
LFSQLTPQEEPLLQVALPWEDGSGQGVHRLPQAATLVLDMHMPLQLCVPEGHWPLQAWLLSMQAPLHSLVFPEQEGMQFTPSQLTLPPDGAWQALHEVPQVATALLATHFPPQRWKPLLQRRLQLPLWQVAAPFGSVGQVVQEVPQPVGLSSAAQLVPQRW